MAEVTVSRNGAMVAAAVADEDVPKVEIRQERERDAKPHQKGPQFQYEYFSREDGGEDADTDVE